MQAETDYTPTVLEQKVNPPAMEEVLIPAGEFTIGSTDKDIDWYVKEFFSESREWYLDETPAQKVYLKEFYIDKYEVTVAQYKRFMEETQRQAPKYFDNAKFNRKNYPVVGVTWQDAADYCQWAGKQLPMEVDWEKAARGTDSRYYPWGSLPDNTKANIRGREDGYRYTAPVGQFPQGESPYGVMDMAGNVWEWTRSWYLSYPGNEHPNELYGKTYRVIKGGSWFSNIDLARTSTRGKVKPDQQFNYVGFRCMRKSPTTAH
ncbi:MAG: formylglycine-generating enzyme family protein [Nitrospinales bacterium]